MTDDVIDEVMDDMIDDVTDDTIDDMTEQELCPVSYTHLTLPTNIAV